MANIHKDILSVADGLRVVRLNVNSGATVPTHHANVDVVATVVRGDGDFIVDGESRAIKPGDVVVMKPKVPHSINAKSDLELIVVHARLASEGEPAACGA